MDIQKILRDFPGHEDSPECVYELEIVKHLTVSLGDTLSVENCMALMWILQNSEMRYSEGFAINDPAADQVLYTLGGLGAASIAAALCPEMCADGLRQAYRRDVKKEFLGEPVESLLAIIRSDPAVVSVTRS